LSNFFNLVIFEIFYSTDALTFGSVAMLVVFALLSLLPVLYQNRRGIKQFSYKLSDRVHDCFHRENNMRVNLATAEGQKWKRSED